MSAFSRLASALRSLPSWAARYIDNRLAAIEASVAGLAADGTFTMASAAAFKAVYVSAADTVALADADASGKKMPVGITTDAPTPTTAVVRFVGLLTGAGSFTAGAPQYLSTTAGALTETPPAAPNATPIAIAINTTDLLVLGPLGAVFDTLRSTSANLGASLISIQDALTLITATTVEGALAELAQFKADLGSIANGKGASLVAIEDAGTFTAAADVEAALAEIYQHILTAQAPILIPLGGWREVDASGDVANTAGGAGVLSSNTTPILRGDTAESWEISWAATNQDPIQFATSLPPDFDGTANATLDLWVYTDNAGGGGIDAATFTVETGWDDGALVSDTATDGTPATSWHKITTTIAAADIPDAPSNLSIALTPAAHANDPIQLVGARLNYKRKLLTS